jgi:acetylglutamate/LysW-gamma-L-alpha-aminoadipate kinase
MDVIKIGGAQGVDWQAICADVARRWKTGERQLLVHGGSDAANRLGEEVGHPPRFVQSPSGHTSRLTDARTLEIFMMATALFNRQIVTCFAKLGVPAVGLSGIDAGLVRAERKRAIRVVENGRVRVVRDDRTGTPTTVNTKLLESLLDQNMLPVIAPVASSEEHDPLNVDGDRLAACVAGALQAQTLLLLTGVPGVLADVEDEHSLIQHVADDEIEATIAAVGGRMKKKVLGAREALRAGVRRVIIAGTTGETPLCDALAGRGTVIGAPPESPSRPSSMTPPNPGRTAALRS